MPKPMIHHAQSDDGSSSQDQLAAAFDEMAEALQAVTNYTAAAHRIACEDAQSNRRLFEVLEKATNQTLRVNEAYRRARMQTDHLKRM